jgi:hypothetical protein
MPDVVSDEDLNALAAEFVLGTLDYEERKGACALLEVDHAFRGIVRIWERRLGELHLMVEAVQPDPEVWDRIKLKIPGLEQVELAIPSHASAAPDAVAVASAAAPPEALSDTAEPAVETSPFAETAPSDDVPSEAPTVAAFGPAAAAPASDSVGPDTPAAGESLTAGRSQSLDETQLRLSELAALLPAAGREDSSAQPAQAADATPEPAAESQAIPETSAQPALEPVEQGFVPPPPMAARSPPPLVMAAPAAPAEVMVRRVGRGWVVATWLMGLVALTLAGLIGAWRYFPERLPEQLRAYSVLNLHPPEPVEERPPAPPPPPAFDE